ncbi:neuropilin-1a isoform 1 precursor [Camelus ferus]|nr:neuropilin-1a isoform 1 precursor [Camelus ferus]
MSNTVWAFEVDSDVKQKAVLAVIVCPKRERGHLQVEDLRRALGRPDAEVPVMKRGRYDYVEVIDGENENGRLWGKFCGKIAPSPVVSSGPFLFIKFVSDYETHGAGFSIRYEIFKRGPECSQNYTAPSGVIKSPGFPEKYPNSLECTYIIFAPKMSEIILEFESFDLEPDSNPPGGMICRYDRLEIWDGFPNVGPHIGHYCGQKTPGRIRASSGILSMVFYTDSAIAKEGFSANYSVLQSSISEDFKCMEALGMESGEIHSDQITASSQYSTNWSAERSRLHYPENGWTPGEDSYREWIQFIFSVKKPTSPRPSPNTSHTTARPGPPGELSPFDTSKDMVKWTRPPRAADAGGIQTTALWCPLEKMLQAAVVQGWANDKARIVLQVDLGLLRFVTAVGTQGAISKETKKKYYVKTYRIEISSNGEDWITIKEGNKPLIFQGNTNPTDVVFGVFPKPLITRFVRIKPMTWETGISLRFEVYGCKITDYPCSGMLGMVSGLISDSQITASNQGERNWMPENIRLVTSRSGWALPPAPHPYVNEWLQVDLGEEKIVRGVIIQGGCLIPAGTLPATRQGDFVILPNLFPFWTELGVMLGEEDAGRLNHLWKKETGPVMPLKGLPVNVKKGHKIIRGQQGQNSRAPELCLHQELPTHCRAAGHRNITQRSGPSYLPEMRPFICRSLRVLVLLEQRAVQRIGLPQVLELHDIQLTVSFFGNVTPHSSGRPSFSKDKDPLIQENTSFEGNNNYDTPELRTFPPLSTRFVRIYPERATHGGLGLRMELLGCELEDVRRTVRYLKSYKVKAPTAGPTTPNGNLVDECDDDQTSCHSGTGDDFQLTGGTTVLTTEKPTAIDSTPQPEANLHRVQGAVRSRYGVSHSCAYSLLGERPFAEAESRAFSANKPFVTAGDGNFLYSQADENQKGKVARLVSPVVYSQNSAHCMTFWYHMSGSHVGTLRVKLRYQKPEEYDQLVWMAIGHQGDHWKEGRVLLHKSLKLYQVIFEGEIGKGSLGGIAVDDIRINNHIPQEDCTSAGVGVSSGSGIGSYGFFPGLGRGPSIPLVIPEDWDRALPRLMCDISPEHIPWGACMQEASNFLACSSYSDDRRVTQVQHWECLGLNPSDGGCAKYWSTQGYEGVGEGEEKISRKPGSVLKTLDPILITIIAMSALGVLLGAVCGVVLYCACWHNGMSERNLSALENYNFELVDGVKLKKDKLNSQSTYSEA